MNYERYEGYCKWFVKNPVGPALNRKALKNIPERNFARTKSLWEQTQEVVAPQLMRGSIYKRNFKCK